LIIAFVILPLLKYIPDFGPINLYEVYESGLLEVLNEIYPESTIYLFGSYSYGEDTIDSDIDIAVVGAKERKVNIESFSKKLRREIRLHFYENLSSINKNLRENILNGIILKGGVKL